MRWFVVSGAALLIVACGRSEAEEAVAATLPNPEAARFQSVAQYGDAVCGEVSAGGAGGYMRFVYREGVASIAPRESYTPSDVAGFDATCRMLGGQGNALDRQICTRAAEARQTIEQAAAFETLWRRSCK